jgi:hypothetical protein
MPKGLASCNNIVALYYNATAIANIADNAAASPLATVTVALTTASGTPSDTMATSLATYTNYANQTTARTTAGWTAPSGGATSNAAAVEFPQCGASGNTITSAKTGKGTGAVDVFHYGDLNASIAVSNQIQPRFPIGAITITEA